MRRKREDEGRDMPVKSKILLLPAEEGQGNAAVIAAR
jgi:hypothetical protein